MLIINTILLLDRQVGPTNTQKLRQEAQFALAEKANGVAVKYTNCRNDLINLDKQVILHTSMIDNNKLLLDGEENKFRMGESSLFLVNSREEKLLEVQEKLNQIYTKRIKTIQYLNWLANNR